ncbi:MAG: hypothetical protein AAB221_00635, partial [Bacteroidota bacterium]
MNRQVNYAGLTVLNIWDDVLFFFHALLFLANQPMPLSKENKRLLKLGEFFVVHTWHYLLRTLWLFFPPILFLLLAYFTFWHVTQGKDLMVITLENPKGKTTVVEFLCFIVALVFWVYVTWYSTRIVGRAKH